MELGKLLCFSTSLGGGGAERQMLALIEGLNSRGIIPEVLNCRSPKNDYPSEAKMNRHFVLVRNRFFEKLCLLWKIFDISPQIIIAYDGGPNLIASIYKFFCRKCKVIVSERNTRHNPISLRNKFLYFLYRYVDVIVSNSKTQAEFLIQTYPKYENKIKVITNYTNTNIYQPNKKESSGVMKIVIPARYYPQKNTLRFLEVINNLNQDPMCPSFICEWYGMNEKNGALLNYFLACKKKMEELHLTNVFLYGYNSNILEVLHSADVICLPSLYEGFSNTLSEAISIGKPVLASRVCDNPTFVRDGWNGYLFDPNSVEDMVNAFRKIFASLDCLDRFGVNSRSLALELFNRDKFIDSYMKLLF